MCNGLWLIYYSYYDHFSLLNYWSAILRILRQTPMKQGTQRDDSMATEASPVAGSPKPLGKTLQRRATMPTSLGCGWWWLGKNHGNSSKKYDVEWFIIVVHHSPCWNGFTEMVFTVFCWNGLQGTWFCFHDRNTDFHAQEDCCHKQVDVTKGLHYMEYSEL